MFNGGGKPGENQAKSKNFGAAISRLFRELRGAKIPAIIATLCAVGGSILTIVAPDRLADLADQITAGLMPGVSIDFDVIWNIVSIIAVLFASSALLELAEGIIMAQVSNGFARDLRKRISHKINRLPLHYFDHNQTGDILSRVTNDVDTVAQSLDNSL